jgi:hypothetical protein
LPFSRFLVPSQQTGAIAPCSDLSLILLGLLFVNTAVQTSSPDYTVATGDLVFAMINGIYTYRIVDEIGANHLGQVGYRFGEQWYSGYVSRALRVGDIRTLKTYCPHRNDWNVQTIRVHDFFLTYNHRVAAVGIERWDDYLQRWYSAGYVAYTDLGRETWRSPINSTSALAPLAAMQEDPHG